MITRIRMKLGRNAIRRALRELEKLQLSNAVYGMDTNQFQSEISFYENMIRRVLDKPNIPIAVREQWRKKLSNNKPI